MLRLKSVGLTMLAILCLLALPVMAQEAAAETTAAAASSPSNISTLIILFGLGMIVVVGGRMYMKDNAEDKKNVN